MEFPGFYDRLCVHAMLFARAPQMPFRKGQMSNLSPGGFLYERHTEKR
jgi:hypothetical protein